MKKAIYLATLLFALVLMNTSCTKDDTTPNGNDGNTTLEQQNLDWKNLTWVKTTLYTDTISIKKDPEILSFKFNLTGDTLYRYNDVSQSEPVAKYINIKVTGTIVKLTPAPPYGIDPMHYNILKNDNTQMILNVTDNPLNPGKWNFYLKKLK